MACNFIRACVAQSPNGRKLVVQGCRYNQGMTMWWRHGPTAPRVPRYHFSAPTREVTGDVEAMALYAGAAVGQVRSTMPAASNVNELAAGMGSVAVGRPALLF